MKQLLLTVLLLLVCVGRMYAQEGPAPVTAPITATVTQLAGQHVYLNVGSEQGVVKGDTLRISTERSLLVISNGRKQSVCAFSGAPFPVTRGMQLVFVVSRSGLPLEEVTSEEPVVAEAVSSIMEEGAPAAPVRQRVKRKIAVEGRLLLNFAYLQSETSTRSTAAGTISRRYATPSLNLNATVKNLPSDMRLNVHVRTDYRYQSRNPIAPEQLMRTYRLNLEKTFAFGQIQAGRFYNRYTQRGGYWDGLSFMAGTRRKGIGASVGFMPDRSNAGFTTQFPRFALFAHYETPRKKAFTYRVAAAYNEIQPSSVFLSHRYLGLEQRLQYDVFSLSQDLQVDQDPVSQAWVVSNLQINGRVKLGQHVSLRGRYALRQPYRLYNIDQPFLNRRDQYTAGVGIQLGQVSFGANYTTRFLNQDQAGETLSGYFNTRPLTRLGLSFSATANRWTSDFGSALFANGGVARQFGKIYTRLDYGFYQSRSPNLDTPIDMHRFSLASTIPFSKSLYWSLRGSVNESRFLRSYSVNTSLQVRF